MEERAAISATIQADLLVACRRRCCLCAYLENDWREKKGQIAHLGSRADPSRENLVWLCLDHHSEFDGRTSQRKNYTRAEVSNYRDHLYREVAERIERGVTYADDVAVTPFVIPTGAGTSDTESVVRLRNFTAIPGLITELRLQSGRRAYRWRGKCVIEGGGEVKDFRVKRAGDTDTPASDDELYFEIEVTDLAEVVTRRRSGRAGQRFSDE